MGWKEAGSYSGGNAVNGQCRTQGNCFRSRKTVIMVLVCLFRLFFERTVKKFDDPEEEQDKETDAAGQSFREKMTEQVSRGKRNGKGKT